MPRTGPTLPAMMTSVRLSSVRSTPVSLPWTLRSTPPTSPNKTIGTTVALSPPLSGTPAADANPKHAEFIRDSPLEWYADGPINDVFADWDDEQGLGDLGRGEGSGEDGDWEDGADPTWDSCM